MAGSHIFQFLDRAHERAPFASGVIGSLRNRLDVAHQRSLPDRVYFENILLPVVINADPSHLLLIGARPYNKCAARALTAQCRDVWSIDRDAAMEPYGIVGKHRTLKPFSLEASSLPVPHFDFIVVDGMINQDIVRDTEIVHFAETLSRIMTPWALLLLGWRSDATNDPLTLDGFSVHFKPVSLGGVAARTSVRDTPHVYDILERIV